MLQAVRMLSELARPSEDRDRTNSRSTEEATTANDIETVQFREIHKNGHLRRTDKTEKEMNKFWVAFCVHDDTEPRIEGYVDQKQATTHSPLWTYSLRGVLHLSPTLCATQRNDYEFCINFNDDRVLRLAAPTYQAMCDWVQVVTRKLTDMRILRPKENVYSKGPERIITRDPTSPLPPPPPPAVGTPSLHRTPGVSPSVSGTSSTSGSENNSGTSASVFTFDDTSLEEYRSQPSTTSSQSQRTVSISNEIAGDSSYESVFLASSHIPNEDNSSISLNSAQNDSSNESYAVLMEYRSAESTESEMPVESSRETRSTCNIRRQLPLREQQVMHLQGEMSHPAGVRLQLGRRDCKDGIAFVDTFGAVWVAGWKQRQHPLLHNFLHIGDLVLSVAGIRPACAAAINNILKNCYTPRAELIVKRLPHARVMVLKRRAESEDFGLKLNGNEVIGLSGALANQGLLPFHVPAADPLAPLGTTVTWTLTEVNGRPLNIFEGGAQVRLGAVGRDVSIVLQPTDLVSSLRKKLQALRNHKKFVVQ